MVYVYWERQTGDEDIMPPPDRVVPGGTSTDSSSSGPPSKVQVIAGAVIAAVTVVLLLITLLVCCRRRPSQKTAGPPRNASPTKNPNASSYRKYHHKHRASLQSQRPPDTVDLPQLGRSEPGAAAEADRRASAPALPPPPYLPSPTLPAYPPREDGREEDDDDDEKDVGDGAEEAHDVGHVNPAASPPPPSLPHHGHPHLQAPPPAATR